MLLAVLLDVVFVEFLFTAGGMIDGIVAIVGVARRLAVVVAFVLVVVVVVVLVGITLVGGCDSMP